MQAWLKNHQAGQMGRMLEWSQEQWAIGAAKAAAERVKNAADERALHQQQDAWEKQFNRDSDDAMNQDYSSTCSHTPVSHDTGSKTDNNVTVTLGDGKLHTVGNGGALFSGSSGSSGSHSTTYVVGGAVVLAGLAIAAGFFFAPEAAVAGAVFVLAASVSDDCGANGIPTRPKWDGMYRADGSARSAEVDGATLSWFDLGVPLDLDTLLAERPNHVTAIDPFVEVEVPDRTGYVCCGEGSHGSEGFFARLDAARSLVWVVSLRDSIPFIRAEVDGSMATFTNNLGNSITVDLADPDFA